MDPPQTHAEQQRGELPRQFRRRENIALRFQPERSVALAGPPPAASQFIRAAGHAELEVEQEVGKDTAGEIYGRGRFTWWFEEEHGERR